MTATRYFHQRVTQFINKIVMAKSNLMSVQSFSWKVEFQSRGAGHIHGCLARCALLRTMRPCVAPDVAGRAPALGGWPRSIKCGHMLDLGECVSRAR